MLVGFHHTPLDALAELWNACLPEGYKISEKQLRQNTVESPVFDWGASVVLIDYDAKPEGFVIVKQSASRLYKGPQADTAHISAIVCPNNETGVDLLSFVKNNLRNRGLYQITFGQDSRHFFAGCPMDYTTLKDLLTVEGFVAGGEYWDLQSDLKEWQPLKPAIDRIKAGPEKVKVEPVKHDQIDHLEDFLKREFPQRWRYDTMGKIKTEGRADFVYALWVNGRVEGFALTQDAAQELLIAGAVFHEGLGTDWCTLGPIGVSQGIRGRGLGDSLLAASLLGLKERGKGMCTIDWTTLKDWYGKHGFEVSRSYASYTLKLEESF
ncbi:MAG TPA: hypothetical protein VGL56_19065 [Fimbriimonadaceae bacterium]|jgi:GNAT superfamily N-acetyltransferase